MLRGGTNVTARPLLCRRVQTSFVGLRATMTSFAFGRGGQDGRSRSPSMSDFPKPTAA